MRRIPRIALGRSWTCGTAGGLRRQRRGADEAATELEESADSKRRPIVDKASLVGSTLSDRYRLVEVIGEGGMGSVFRAEHLVTGAMVAVKLLHPEFVGVGEVVQRFER